ncbi:MAG: hypothetical protein EOO41_05760, partial [Methanobacteriota archaeon]
MLAAPPDPVAVAAAANAAAALAAAAAAPSSRKPSASGKPSSDAGKKEKATGGSSKDAAAAAAAAEAAASMSATARPSEPPLLQFVHDFRVTGDVTLAARLNTNPMLHTIMGLKPELLPTPEERAAAAAAAAAPAATSKAGGGASKKGAAAADKETAKAGAASSAANAVTGGGSGASAVAVTLPALPYVAWIPLDCSDLLANESSCALTFGDVHAAKRAFALAAPSVASVAMPLSGGDGSSTPSSPAPFSGAPSIAPLEPESFAVPANGSSTPGDGVLKPYEREAWKAALSGAHTGTAPALTPPTYFRFLHIAVVVTAAWAPE